MAVATNEMAKRAQHDIWIYIKIQKLQKTIS